MRDSKISQSSFSNKSSETLTIWSDSSNYFYYFLYLSIVDLKISIQILKNHEFYEETYLLLGKIHEYVKIS